MLAFVGGLTVSTGATREKQARARSRISASWAQARELIETFSHGMKRGWRSPPRWCTGRDPCSTSRCRPRPEGALELRRRLLRLSAEGVTIPLDAQHGGGEELCHRIGIIDRGRLVALGTLDELRVQATRSTTPRRSRRLPEFSARAPNDIDRGHPPPRLLAARNVARAIRSGRPRRVADDALLGHRVGGLHARLGYFHGLGAFGRS